jgi:hypothetical protein
MATYYKYQNPSEIGAAPTLDWGTVISNVNQNLQKQEEQRYENREADKKLTNDILTKANEVSLTSDPNLNALITNMGYDTKKNIFELQKKLESNQISRSDFTIANQNTSASIAQLNQFTKTYGADYDKYLKDVQEGKTSAYADFMQKWKGGFQNFKDKKLIHNPTDGRLYVAELDDKGKVKEGPLGMVPMSTLVEVKNFDDKKIDVLAETNRYATQMKPFVDLVRDGKIESLEALSNMPDFNDFVNNVTEAIAKNEKGYASILTDTDGNYSITGEGASSGKNIGLKNNGAGEMIPMITDEQKTRTRDIIKEYLIAQTGIKETGMERFAPQRAAGGGRPTKPPKYTPEVGGLSNIETNGVLKGVALGVDGVIVPKGKGIEDRIDAVSYDWDPDRKKMLVKMRVTQISGTESEGETIDADGNVTVSQGSKNTKEKMRILNSMRDSPTMSIYVRKIPKPKGGFFQSLNELEQLLKSNYQDTKRLYNSTVEENQGKAGTKKVIKRSELAAKAKAAGYSASEYEKLLKQKGVKIE